MKPMGRSDFALLMLIRSVIPDYYSYFLKVL